MNSTDYSVDLRDILFVQKELFNLGQLAQLEAYKDFSEEDFDLIVQEGKTFIEEVMAPLNKIGDEEGTHLKDGVVKTPPGFKEAWKQAGTAGWIGITSQAEWGGQGLPFSVGIGMMEGMYGANPSLYATMMLTSGAAGLITEFGSEAQKKAYAEKMIAGEWGGTMCLSEPNAGSAVGDITTSAVKAAGGEHYLIRGTKCWITGGDHDFTENIVHLVLGRIEGAPPGPKGISLFIVPKFRLDDSGKPTIANGVNTLRLEHKLGIKASPTAVLELGADAETWGYVLEEENRGLMQMFKLMNEARLTVAIQGLGAASGAFRNALAYANERKQGIPIELGKDQSAERTAIVDHPDVRNMLLSMKAIVEGARGLIYAVGFYNDMALHGPKELRGHFRDLADILTPIAKNFGADQGYEAIRLGVQVLGGVGFTEEFPLAQNLRDTKIASIYEGTTGIQGLDLVTRKLPMRGGELFQTLLAELETLSPEQARLETVNQAIAEWRDTVERLGQVVGSLANIAEELGPREAVFNATDVTVYFGDVMSAYYLLKSALIAEGKLAEMSGGERLEIEGLRKMAMENEDARFYYNKIKTAEHYVYQILPRSRSVAAKVQSRNFAALEAIL